jgi:hypothetical protein
MVKSLAAGVILLLISLCIGIFESSVKVLMESSAVISSALIILAVILSGAAVSGDRSRSNDAFETKEDRQSRFRWIQNLFLTSLPCLFVAMIIYFSSK